MREQLLIVGLRLTIIKIETPVLEHAHSICYSCEGPQYIVLLNSVLQ